MLSGYCDPWSYLYAADANDPAQGTADAAFGSSIGDTAAAAALTSLELAESGTAADVRVDLRDEIPELPRMAQIAVTVPDGVSPGMMMKAKTADGRAFMTPVPAFAGPWETLMVSIPASAMSINGKLIQIGDRGEVKLDASGKSFMPVGAEATVGLKTVDGEPLMLASGRWYYEVTIGHGHLGSPRFGWCDERFRGTNDFVGKSQFAWGVDGVSKGIFHDSRFRHYGMEWKEGDVLGCLADLDAKTLSFSLNGSTDAPMGVAFEGIGFEGGLFPALSADLGVVSCNFGEDLANPLKHLPDGYSPIVPSRGECGGRMGRRH